MTLSPEPYPNAYTLEGICHEAMGNNIDKFAQYCTPDFQVESAGQDHSMKGLFDSASGLKDHRSQFVSMLDEKTIKREVVRVIGGGQQPWAAVECMTTATTNAGKSLVSAFLPVGEPVRWLT